MVGLLLGLGIASAVSGIFGASSRWAQRNAEYQSQMQDLDRQKNQLDEQNRQFQESYGLAVSTAKDRTSEQNAELDLLGQQTVGDRDASLGVTAKGQEMQQGVEQMQLATLVVDASKAEGVAVQQAASSGFRDDGTLMDSVEQVNRDTSDSIRQAKAQLSLSRYSTFQGAKQAYTSATQQADAYQRQVEMNSSELQRQLGELALKKQQVDETYKRQAGYIDSDINYMQTTGKNLKNLANHADLFASMVSGANSIGKAWL